jgi:hypothetical protein
MRLACEVRQVKNVVLTWYDGAGSGATVGARDVNVGAV